MAFPGFSTLQNFATLPGGPSFNFSGGFGQRDPLEGAPSAPQNRWQRWHDRIDQRGQRFLPPRRRHSPFGGGGLPPALGPQDTTPVEGGGTLLPVSPSQWPIDPFTLPQTPPAGGGPLQPLGPQFPGPGGAGGFLAPAGQGFPGPGAGGGPLLPLGPQFPGPGAGGGSPNPWALPPGMGGTVFDAPGTMQFPPGWTNASPPTYPGFGGAPVYPGFRGAPVPIGPRTSPPPAAAQGNSARDQLLSLLQRFDPGQVPSLDLILPLLQRLFGPSGLSSGLPFGIGSGGPGGGGQTGAGTGYAAGGGFGGGGIGGAI